MPYYNSIIEKCSSDSKYSTTKNYILQAKGYNPTSVKYLTEGKDVDDKLSANTNCVDVLRSLLDETRAANNAVKHFNY